MPELANDIRQIVGADVAALIGQGRYELGNEKATQSGIWEVLGAYDYAGHNVAREVRLSPRDIVDFMVEGVAVEVKLKRNRSVTIMRQLMRYAAHEQVKELVLVTNRAVDVRPTTLNGKPVYYVSLGRAWL